MNRNKNILFMEKVFQVLQCTEKSFPCFSHLRVTLKSLQFSLFSSFSFFDTANLDGQTKVASRANVKSFS